MERFRRALILDEDPHTRVQEGQFAQPVFQRLEAVIQVGERTIGDIGLGACQKAHLSAAHAGGWAHLMHMHHAVTMFEPGAVFDVIAPNPQLQPLRQRVHHRHAHAMQTARHFIGIAAVIGVVEFAARVQLGHDDLGRRDALFLVHVHRNAAPIVAHRNAAVGVDFHGHCGGMAGQRLVNAVVDNLIDHVMQARPIVGVTNIHAGALANCF